MTDRAIELLEEQQRNVKERSAPWMVAEQLKDICRREPHSAEILAQDLENASMSITEAGKEDQGLCGWAQNRQFCLRDARGG